jgi:glutamate formiminotransferase/formiminotetrahydrofolate cyclodeaminase
VRAGEYEGIEQKISLPEWQPDFGPAKFNVKSGNIAIGARDLLIAYNVNLNTKSVRRANSVAFDVREQGRVKREGDPVTGKVMKDEQGNEIRIPGKCKSVKGIGWYIEEYGLAQVSMNLTNINDTPLHIAFDACNESAFKRGMRVTGSEMIRLVPIEIHVGCRKIFPGKATAQRRCFRRRADLYSSEINGYGRAGAASIRRRKSLNM